MKLGTKAFAASGVVDSDRYYSEGLYTTLVVIPTQAGTAQVVLFDKETDVEHLQGSAVAGLANVDNTFVLTYPIGGAYAGAALRYTNTSAVAGTASFSGGSAAT